MSYEHILYTVRDGLATLTFNRPGQLNAMNAQMMREIIAALEELHADPAVRVGIITGAGSKAFMAGADLKEYAAQTPRQFDDFTWRGRHLYNLIESSNKPVIAAVNGFAFGGGFEIALACDLILAADTAKFGLPEILLNLIPGGGGTQRLVQKVGLNRANELLLTGRTASAAELHAWGCVNALHPADTLLAEVEKLARQLAEKEPAPLAAIKQLTRLAASPISSATLTLEAQTVSRLYQSPAGQAKIQEFLQKSLERQKAKAAASSASAPAAS
ncbi:MAG: enoyl-CoA hydratase/isomerase family protein [Burkholderiales bacterium]|nr:enoyl-CoA hydratase/isomerase family protein [Opitutaceae bacterium]